jgi:TFIIF-interacting CTD phosphatase-like protein
MEDLVTQVQKKKAEVHGKLEVSVQTRRMSQARKPNITVTNSNTITNNTEGATRPRACSKASILEEKVTGLHNVVTSPRARAASKTIHDTYVRPTAPYKDDHLLPPFKSLRNEKKSKSNMKCLVLDLDETLIHSSFKPVDVYDYIVPIEIEDVLYQVFNFSFLKNKSKNHSTLIPNQLLTY